MIDNIPKVLLEWTELDFSSGGYRRIKNNAPESAVKEIKEYDDWHYEKTGRHILVAET